MNTHTKMYNDLKSFFEADEAMDEFQLLHNILRNDYISLLKLTEQHINSQEEFNTLYNSCLIRLFTMIEADLFGLGKLDPYPKVKPKENFFEQFSNTFDQISKTWNKKEIKEAYFTNHYIELGSIKNLRNSFVHPEKITDVPPATIADFERLKAAFNNYNEFMAGITNKFFIGMDGANLTPDEIQEIIKKKEAKGLKLSPTSRINLE